MSTRVLATVLVLAPVCDTLEAALSPLARTSTTADIAAIQQHQTRFELSVMIGLLGTLLLLAGLVGLAARTVAYSPWASRTAAVATGAAMAAFVGIRLGQGIELQGVRDGLSASTVAGLLDHQQSNPIGASIMAVFLAGTVVGMLALGVAAWRAGLPRPAAVLVATFPIVDMAFEGLGAGVITHALLLVGLAWIAATLLRRTAQPSHAIPAPAPTA